MPIRDREFTIRIRRARADGAEAWRFVAELFEGIRFVLPITVDQDVMAKSFGHILLLVDAGAPRRPPKARAAKKVIDSQPPEA